MSGATLHRGISQLDLRRLVRETGGEVEDIRRTGEYRVRYPHMPKPSAAASARNKNVARRIMVYVRHALNEAQRTEESSMHATAERGTETFAASLKRLREERGMSHADLADALKCERLAVAEWERGEAFPSGDHMGALFAVLPRLREFARPPASVPERAASWGERLKAARKSEGLSLQGLADLLGVSDGKICHWEANRNAPSEATFAKLREAFPSLPAPDAFGREYRFGRHAKPHDPKPVAVAADVTATDPRALGSALGAALAAQVAAEARVKQAEKDLADATTAREAARRSAKEAHEALLRATIGGVS